MLWGVRSRLNYVRTRDLVRSFRPDIVLAWNMNSIGIHPLLATQEMEVPSVIVLYDYWLMDLRRALDAATGGFERIFRSFYLGLREFSRLQFERLIICSQSLKETHVASGFPDEKMHIIPLGLPRTAVFDGRSAENGGGARNRPMRLLFAGRLIPDKGPDIAIEAFAALAEQLTPCDITLDIIGDGPTTYVEELKAMVLRYGFEDQIRFLGHFDHLDLLQKYRYYDALLFPSRWQEPFGLTILEAMSSGVPVIATEIGGPAELISAGESGLLTPPDDAPAMARAAARLYLDPGLWSKISLQARGSYQMRYSIEHVVDQLAAVLRDVL
jgi:glycogen(starch) synthase